MGTPKTFAIRTFGCQMNEHDSERLAGLMVGEGMVAVTDESEADVVIFNTCTIRENADLKLYSALGQMKALKEQHDHKTHQEMFDAPYDTIPYPTKLPGGRLEITLDPACIARSAGFSPLSPDGRGPG